MRMPLTSLLIEEHEEHEDLFLNQSPLRVLRELRGEDSGLRASPALDAE